MFLSRVSEFIKENNLLSSDTLHLVALSGGADSVCLLLMLKQLGFKVEAVHCNFHLRGEESDRDEHFCRELCQRENIAIHVVHFDTTTYAELHHVSIEMAARELRYDYFEKLRHDINASDICVAHHKDDSVETLLMNLVRGTGIHGLQGIKPQNGYVIRPLLCLSRKEIENWLDDNSHKYVTDSTNLEADVVRNKLRLNVIPLLADINPSASENIYRTALRMVEAGRVFDAAIERDRHDAVSAIEHSGVTISAIDTEKLLCTSSPEYLLFTILSPLGFTPAQIEDISRSDFSQSGKRWENGSYVLVTDRGKLLVVPMDTLKKMSMRIPETGVYVLNEDASGVTKISIRNVAIDENFVLSKSADCVCLDADKVKFPLLIRNVKEGDRFVPFGMKGSKLVSDYLTDKKKNYLEKSSQLVLLDAEDKVLWLVNERPDARSCIMKHTINSLVVRYYRE